MKKISFLLAILMLVQCFLLVACNQKDIQETTPQETTPQETTPAEPPVAPDNFVKILAADLFKYNLICAQRTPANIMSQFWQLQSQMQKLSGIELLAETDYMEESVQTRTRDKR